MDIRGAVAMVIFRDGNAIYLIAPTAEAAGGGLASTPIAEIALDRPDKTLVRRRRYRGFRAGGRGWNAGRGRLADCRVRRSGLAAAYASERKAFGQPIGTFQAISHPLADFSVDTDGALFRLAAIRDVRTGRQMRRRCRWPCGGRRALPGWPAQGCTASAAMALPPKYDIHLTLHAESLPLILAIRRSDGRQGGGSGGETVALPGPARLDRFDLGDEALAAAEVDAFSRPTHARAEGQGALFLTAMIRGCAEDRRGGLFPSAGR